MQDLSQPGSSSQDESDFNHFNLMKEENTKLARENAALKNSLQKEELYHKNLYQQWKELNAQVNENARKLEQVKSKQDPKTKAYHYGFYGLLIVTLILLILNFYLFTKRGDKNSGTVQHSLIKKTSDSPSTISYATKQPDERSDNKSLLSSPSVNKESSSIEVITDSSIKNVPSQYVVKVKSFFHNKPDTTTRRSTFLLPWNDEYGIVTALDERNGFVYVVFKNRIGRTSKGWILKSDLEPVKP